MFSSQKILIVGSLLLLALNSCGGGGGGVGPLAGANGAPETPPSPFPALPENFSVADRGNESQVELTWDDSSENEDGFIVERQTQSGSDWVDSTVISLGPNLESLLNAPGLGTYRYRIAAINSLGQSAWTSWATVAVTDGWTQFTPSADSRIIYVSSSLGNDANNGLSESTPKRTISAGYNLLRDGYPDWLLLRRGDTWNGEYITNWDRSGRSATERMLFAAYGPLTLERPLVIPGGHSFFYHNAGGSPQMNYLAIVGIHARGPGGGQIGISTIGPADYFLVEDCKLENFASCLTAQGEENNGYMNHVTVRRNVMIDSYSNATHSSGMFAIRIDNLTVEENIVDYNGYREGVADATIFNHGLYLSSGCTNVKVNRNIVSRSSSHGAQMRSGAQCTDNLFIRNAIALFVVDQPSTVFYNVVLEGKDITPSLVRGWGIEALKTNGADFAYNIVAHKLSASTAFAFRAGYDETTNPNTQTFRNNLSYDWRGEGMVIGSDNNADYDSVTIRNNYFQRSDGGNIVYHRPVTFDATRFTYLANTYATTSETWRIGNSIQNFSSWVSNSHETGASNTETFFPDPNRSVASYNAIQGGAATFDAFIAECRRQRKGFWRREYTAPVVNQYIRDGFSMQGPH